MLKKYEAVCYEYLRPEQIKDVRSKKPIAYIVAGSLEWHSFQNPLGTDSLKAHAICCEAALKHGGIVLPQFYQGLLGEGWGPKDWENYTLGFNDLKMFESVMSGIVKALIKGEWKVIVGVTGHDVAAQRDALQRTIDTVTKNEAATGFALMEGELHTPDDDIPLKMDHAGAWETSCMMYAYPEKADLVRLKCRKLSSDEDFKMSGPEGIGGKNPLKYASSDMGKKIIEKMGNLIGSKANAMLESHQNG